jgi:hypothetical protein
MALYSSLVLRWALLLCLLRTGLSLEDTAQNTSVGNLTNIEIASNDDTIPNFLARFNGDKDRFIRKKRGKGFLEYTEPKQVKSVKLTFFALASSFDAASWAIWLTMGKSNESAQIFSTRDIAKVLNGSASGETVRLWTRHHALKLVCLHLSCRRVACHGRLREVATGSPG